MSRLHWIQMGKLRLIKREWPYLTLGFTALCHWQTLTSEKLNPSLLLCIWLQAAAFHRGTCALMKRSPLPCSGFSACTRCMWRSARSADAMFQGGNLRWGKERLHITQHTSLVDFFFIAPTVHHGCRIIIVTVRWCSGSTMDPDASWKCWLLRKTQVNIFSHGSKSGNVAPPRIVSAVFIFQSTKTQMKQSQFSSLRHGENVI